MTIEDHLKHIELELKKVKPLLAIPEEVELCAGIIMAVDILRLKHLRPHKTTTAPQLD